MDSRACPISVALSTPPLSEGGTAHQLSHPHIMRPIRDNHWGRQYMGTWVLLGKKVRMLDGMKEMQLQKGNGSSVFGIKPGFATDSSKTNICTKIGLVFILYTCNSYFYLNELCGSSRVAKDGILSRRCQSQQN